MPRRSKGKRKEEAELTTQGDQPQQESGDLGPSNPVDSPTASLIKPALPTSGIHMNQASSLHQNTPGGQLGVTSLVSRTVINFKSASNQRSRLISANTYDALQALVEHPIENWAEEATTASAQPDQAAKSSIKPLPVETQPATRVVTPGPQPVRLTQSEIRNLKKTPQVILTGERGNFSWHVAQGLLKTFATKYEEDSSFPFPSGLTLDFPQTPRSVLKYVQQFVEKGGVDALHTGAVLYPGRDVRALVQLQSVARELGILELEARASRDLALVQNFLHRHSIFVAANERRTAAAANPELFIVMAEFDNRLYKVHCRKRELEKRSTQVTRGTLRCVGVIRHFVEYNLPQGPFDLIARDHDGFWTVTCSTAMLKVDFVLKRDQEVYGHLDLVQLSN